MWLLWLPNLNMGASPVSSVVPAITLNPYATTIVTDSGLPDLNPYATTIVADSGSLALNPYATITIEDEGTPALNPYATIVVPPGAGE
jgi:hypothetical protein